MDAQPGLRTMLNTPEDDDEEEYFVDAPEEDDDDEKKKKIADEKQKRSNAKAEYDGRKRDPRFSNAEKSCLWELVLFIVEQIVFFCFANLMFFLCRFLSKHTIIHPLQSILNNCLQANSLKINLICTNSL
jgi:hypothetical protein